MDDDEPPTIDTSRPNSTSTLTDILPDAPAPFEVMFDRVTIDGRESEASAYRTLDVWTKNRVYRVDSTLTCVEVLDRTTGNNDRTHGVLGSRLVGGQRKYGKTIHQTRPFPVPGTEAVFVAKDPNVPPKVTSGVERVVLHVRVTTVVLEHDNAFDDVTNALLHPGAGRLSED